MGDFLSKVLDDRGLKECPIPLWKLKITDAEYEELKKHLRKVIDKWSGRLDNFFPASNERDATLFYAEYWRREYCDGPHSIEAVYQAIGLPSYCKCLNGFYQAARHGAETIGIPFYVNPETQITSFLDSLLYQGGLPMKAASKSDNVWHQFVRGLINKRLNIEDLDLGDAAVYSESLKEYGLCVNEAIDKKQYELMPFYCEKGEKDDWYRFLIELASEEKKRRSSLQSFGLEWKFRLDESSHQLSAIFEVKGARRLSEAFLKANNLLNLDYFTALVQVNGKVEDVFEYLHRCSTYPAVSSHVYHLGDQISIVLGDQDYSYLKDELDMSVPHLLYLDDSNFYVVGNQLGRCASLLLIPEGWKLTKKGRLKSESYEWEGCVLSAVQIPADFQASLSLSNAHDTVVFDPFTPLFWTEVQSAPVSLPGVEEVLYHAGNSAFVLCSDEADNGRHALPAPVEFRSKWSDAWTDVPAYGEIYVRAKQEQGAYVVPARLINVGDGFELEVLSADESSCTIRVSWEHGTVGTEEGVEKADDVWLFLKEEMTGSHVHFTLTPHDDSRNQFTLTLRAPFKEFVILDPAGQPVAHQSSIPYSEVEKYRYHLLGLNLRSYTYGKNRRELRWLDDQLYVIEDNQRLKSIPYEGSLMTLFDSRAALRDILSHSSDTSLRAKLDVNFVTSSKDKLSVSFKKAPYSLKQVENKLEVYAGSKLLDFDRNLKLLRLDDPNNEAVLLPYTEGEGYVLPQEIMAWGPTLVYGATRGRIFPKMVDMYDGYTPEVRMKRRMQQIEEITQALPASQLGDEQWQHILGWFYRAQEEEIPASSLLCLHSVTLQSDALLCFAFQLFTDCHDDNERHDMHDKLMAFSAEQGFSWYWLQPKLNQVMFVLYPHLADISSKYAKDIFRGWALQKGTEGVAYLECLDDETQEETYQNSFFECIHEVIMQFTEWIKALSYHSLVNRHDESYDELTDTLAASILEPTSDMHRIEDENETFVEYTQDTVSEEAKKFFQSYQKNYVTGNEAWLRARVDAVCDQLQGNVDLFAESVDVRRSIVFCQKSCQQNFLLALYNQLASN